MQTHAINDIDELVNRLVLKSVLGRSDILSGGGGSCVAGARGKGEMIGDIVDSAVGSGQYDVGVWSVQSTTRWGLVSTT